MANERTEKPKGGRTRLIIGLVVVVVVLMLAKLLNVQAHLKDLLAWIEAQGSVGAVIFMGIYVLATVLFVPGSILTLGAGFVFGVVNGTIYVSIGSVIGATGAFLVGRYLARSWVATKVEGNERFAAIDDAVGREGWKIVILTRLSPIFPFNLLNYAYGLTKVSLKGYFFSSWIGMLPGTIMYVYIGSLAGDLATLGGARSRTTMEWILYGVGLAATIGVTLYVTRVAKRALNQRALKEDAS